LLGAEVGNAAELARAKPRGECGTNATLAGYLAMLTNQLNVAKLRLLDLDDRSHKFFRPYSRSAPVRALDVFSKLGDQPELRVIAGCLVLAGMFVDSNRLVRASARMLVAHEAATLVKNIFKTNIDRTRPRSATSRKDKKPRKGTSSAKEESSFPSGHSAGAIAAARAVSREYPEYGAAVTTAAVLVAASQVPRCAHYPTDVAAGILLGLAVEATTNAIWDGLKMNGSSNIDKSEVMALTPAASHATSVA